ncbi:MAG: hypothetical protein HKL79_04365 [Thermoplasmata archaeon]|nr:hypothetical protein [Thermoplasmata archaeon]
MMHESHGPTSARRYARGYIPVSPAFAPASPGRIARVAVRPPGRRPGVRLLEEEEIDGRRAAGSPRREDPTNSWRRRTEEWVEGDFASRTQGS